MTPPAAAISEAPPLAPPSAEAMPLAAPPVAPSAPSAGPAANGRISYEDYLHLPGEARSEWVDGKVIPMTAPSIRHQDLVGFLTALLRVFSETRGLGRVFASPVQLKGPGDGPGREPDLVFVSAANLHRIHPLYIEGPTDLVVEVLSPDSQSRDRGEKFTEYEAMGAGEYWLIDPARREAAFYSLGEDKWFHPIKPDAEGRMHSRAIEGLWIDPEWLWAVPPPATLGLLKRMGIA